MTRSQEDSCCHGQALGLGGAGLKRGSSAAMHPWICPSLPEPSEGRRSLALHGERARHGASRLQATKVRSTQPGPWSLPASQRPGRAPLSSGTPSRPLSSRVKHYAKFSQLLVVNATAADTGEYSCWSLQCQDSPCQEGEDRTGKTFVFFADPQELFVPTEDYYEVVQLRTNRPTLLPCQVTSPLARVTLHREFPPEEVPVDGREISYDVRRGFTIHRSRPSYAGSLFCMASLGGVRQISTKYMLVYINYPSSAPKPTVRASGTSARAGENFNVTCTVLGEPEVAVAFTWEYPGQKMGRPPYVRERTDLVRRGGQVRQESESTLYVDEARDVDAGLYTCRAENLEGSASTATRVRVLPAPRGGRPG